MQEKYEKLVKENEELTVIAKEVGILKAKNQEL